MSASASASILIIDDNVDAADSLALMLRLMRYRVHVAYGGCEGIAAALNLLPHVVLLDIGMPRLNGFKVAREIRDALGPGIRLIAYTAWGDIATVRHCKEAGFDHHLMKPAGLSDILALADPGNS